MKNFGVCFLVVKELREMVPQAEPNPQYTFTKYIVYCITEYPDLSYLPPPGKIFTIFPTIPTHLRYISYPGLCASQVIFPLQHKDNTPFFGTRL